MKTIKPLFAALFILSLSAGVFAQTADNAPELSQTVPLFTEAFTVSLPEDWEVEYDEEQEQTTVFNDALQLVIWEDVVARLELELDDATSESVLTAVVNDVLEPEEPATAEDMETVELELPEADEPFAFAQFTVADAVLFAVAPLAIPAADETDETTEAEEAPEAFVFVNAAVIEDEAFSDEQTALVGAILASIAPADDADLLAAEPCLVSAASNQARLHVGPGTNRAVITFMPEGEFEPLALGEADDGSSWFQMDKEEVAPNTAALELWVASADVTTTGDCGDIADTAAPPVIESAADDTTEDAQAAAPADTTTEDTQAAAPADTTTEDTQAAAPADTTTEDTQAAAAPAEPAQPAAPAPSGGAIFASGTYNFTYGDAVTITCSAGQVLTVPPSAFGLNASTVNVSVAGNGSSFTAGPYSFSLTGGGDYTAYEPSLDGQLFVRPVSATRLEGRGVFKATLNEGEPCDASIQVFIYQ